MINDVFDAISIRLHKLFGDDYTYEVEDIKQGLNKPCFFISLLEPITEPLLGKRKKVIYPFDIACILPVETESLKKKLYCISDTLHKEMEFITMVDNQKVHGTSIHSEFVDGVLHFLVNYNMTVISIEGGDPMEDLKHNSELKG